MGVRSTASYNAQLTDYAYGLSQDLRSALASFIAPVVTVPAGKGQYKAFDDKNAFQIYDTERPLGGPANRIMFSASDPTFDCRPQALEVGIDDQEYRDAGDGNEQRLEESKIKTLISSSTLAYENKVVTLAKTVSAVAARGDWSDENVSPVDQIDEQIEALATATGMLPNRMVLGIGAWRVAKNHAKVLARANTTRERGVTLDQFASMLLNPAIEVRVGILSKDATKFGATKSATNIVGAEVFIFIGAPTPTQYDPSWMKTFRTRDGAVDAVWTYRDEGSRSTIHAVDWTEDIKITGSGCVKRLTIT